MNFNFPLLKPLRMLLFPFSLVYWLVIFVRNKLYDANILKAARFNIPIVCVGNIAAGGTGKSPMVEWILRQFEKDLKLATLSRGINAKPGDMRWPMKQPRLLKSGMNLCSST